MKLLYYNVANNNGSDKTVGISRLIYSIVSIDNQASIETGLIPF